MTLDQLSIGKSARVLEVTGGPGLHRNLSQMGIHSGDMIKISGASAFRGPILVEIHGSRIALGRGVARRILIEPM